MEKFNEEEKKRLEEICENNEEITIEGFNGLGEEFKTVCKISKEDFVNDFINKQLGIEDYEKLTYSIPVSFFGNRKMDDFDSKIDVIFYLNYVPKYMPETMLYVKTILDNNGEPIYENDSLKISKKKSPIEFNDTNNVVKELKNMIGKPIIVKDKEGNFDKGVFTSFGGITKKGSVVLEVTNEPLKYNIDINPYSVLYKEDENGKLVEIARNCKKEMDETLGK